MCRRSPSAQVALALVSRAVQHFLSPLLIGLVLCTESCLPRASCVPACRPTCACSAPGVAIKSFTTGEAELIIYPDTTNGFASYPPGGWCARACVCVRARARVMGAARVCDGCRAVRHRQNTALLLPAAPPLRHAKPCTVGSAAWSRRTTTHAPCCDTCAPLRLLQVLLSN